LLTDLGYVDLAVGFVEQRYHAGALEKHVNMFFLGVLLADHLIVNEIHELRLVQNVAQDLAVGSHQFLAWRIKGKLRSG